MQKFTVLLLRPDYLADTFGHDTYLAHVEADTAEQAKLLAQTKARDVDESPPSEDDCPEDQKTDAQDYHVLFMAHGHLENLNVD